MFVRLVHGTLEYQYRIDYTLNSFSKLKVNKMKPYIRNLLRMSVFQLLFTDKIPDSAVCDEAVKLIKKTAYRNLSGFVNGILRNIARSREDLNIPNDAVRYSVPEWLLKLLSETVGDDKAIGFLDYSLEEHGVSIRRCGTDEVSVITDIGRLTEAEDWKNGLITVQDFSSAQPVKLAGIKSGDTVIDVCASPGGKSIQASEKTGPEGKVYACDLTEKKLERIKENIVRLKRDNIFPMVQDATVRKEEFINLADVVLADCPCSGIGTVSKKPEIKNRLKPEDCIALAEIQRNILDNVCDYVKAGGKLVYSTCTLDHFENEDNLRYFLKRHPEFSLETEKILVPHKNQEIPFDGFYIAVLKKNG